MGGGEGPNLANGEKASLGYQKGASMEGGMAAVIGADLEGNSSASLEESVEANLGESVGRSS